METRKRSSFSWPAAFIVCIVVFLLAISSNMKPNDKTEPGSTFPQGSAAAASPSVSIDPRALSSIDAWQPYLLSADREFVRSAVRALVDEAGRSKGYVPFAVNVLMEAEKKRSDAVFCQDVAAAVGELIQIDTAGAMQSLMNYPQSQTAANAMQTIGDPAVDAMIDKLKEMGGGDMSLVAEMLGRVGGSRALALLTALLQDPQALDVPRDMAAAALGSLGSHDPALAQAATQVLAGILKDKAQNTQLRGCAAGALATIGTDDAVDILYAAAGDKSMDRSPVYLALGQVGSKHAVELLVKALKNKDETIRVLAINALGEAGDDSAAEALISLFSDKDYTVRSRAADAVGRIGGDRVLALLQKALKAKSATVRAVAAQAMGKGAYSGAVDMLIPALKDKDKSVRSSAAAALGDIGDSRAAVALIDALKGKRIGDDTCVYALGKLTGDEAVDAMAAALQSPDLTVRFALVRVLGTLKSPRSVDALISVLGDKDGNVRHYAISALGDIGDRRAVAPLVAVLNNKSGGENTDDIAAALGKIGDPQAVEPLIALLGSKKSTTQHAAVTALTGFADERAAGPLCGLLSSPDDSLASLACTALGKIAPEALTGPLMAKLDSKNTGDRYYAAYLLDQADDKGAMERFNAALEAGDIAIVAGAHRYFIKLGKAGSEPVLIQALNEFGYKEMGETYLNCGNRQLDEAARKWASEHHYTVMTMPGGQSVAWGSLRP